MHAKTAPSHRCPFRLDTQPQRNPIRIVVAAEVDFTGNIRSTAGLEGLEGHESQFHFPTAGRLANTADQKGIRMVVFFGGYFWV